MSQYTGNDLSSSNCYSGRTLMPAMSMVSMAAGTPACSLSSIAVMPVSSRSRSTNSAAAASYK